MFGKIHHISKIIIVICVLLLSSCVTDDGRTTYTIEGRLIDGTNPANKFAHRKLKFQNERYRKDIIILGQTVTDTNGYFKISYEFTKDYQINFMRIVVDSNFIGARKLVYLPIGSNWYRDFYVGERAIADLYINEPIAENDTLFISIWGSLVTVIGPHPAGYVNRFSNPFSNQYTILGYDVGYNNYKSQTRKTIKFTPTGEPMVDEVHLDLTN